MTLKTRVRQTRARLSDKLALQRHPRFDKHRELPGGVTPPQRKAEGVKP